MRRFNNKMYGLQILTTQTMKIIQM